jgi:hypothetical protein
MKTVICVLGTIFLAMPAGSRPQEQGTRISTVAGFLEICGAADRGSKPMTSAEKFDAGECVGWVGGFAAGLLEAEAAYGVISKKPLTIVCWPTTITNIQLVHIIKKYIADHPEQENLGTNPEAFLAIRSAFPCPAQSAP